MSLGVQRRSGIAADWLPTSDPIQARDRVTRLATVAGHVDGWAGISRIVLDAFLESETYPRGASRHGMLVAERR